MMCYKDTTFCSFWNRCKYGIDCTKALKDEVKERAKKLGLDISQFLYEPICFKDRKKSK